MNITSSQPVFDISEVDIVMDANWSPQTTADGKVVRTTMAAWSKTGSQTEFQSSLGFWPYRLSLPLPSSHLPCVAVGLSGAASALVVPLFFGQQSSAWAMSSIIGFQMCGAPSAVRNALQKPSVEHRLSSMFVRLDAQPQSAKTAAADLFGMVIAACAASAADIIRADAPIIFAMTAADIAYWSDAAREAAKRATNLTQITNRMILATPRRSKDYRGEWAKAGTVNSLASFNSAIDVVQGR